MEETVIEGMCLLFWALPGQLTSYGCWMRYELHKRDEGTCRETMQRAKELGRLIGKLGAKGSSCREGS